MKKSLLFFLVTFSCVVKAQLNVTYSNNATQLLSKLAGYGVTLTNPTLVCGNDSANVKPSGIFTVVSSNLGLDSGIVLTSGSAVNNGFNNGVANPNTVFASSASWTWATAPASNDPDLTMLSGLAQTRDKCILEFDFSTIGDTVKFDYVFGSEEYQSYACTSFFDVFGFFISGPGIAGPFSLGAKNMALIPGTTCPVGVNTVNDRSLPPPTCCGGGPLSTCQSVAGCGGLSPYPAFFVCNSTGTSVVYRGFSTVFTAISPVIPCSTYHMKMAIADGTDQALDSGVFLKAGSFSSNQIQIKLTTGLIGPNGPYLIEGCDSGKLNIKRNQIVGTPYSDTVHFLIAGSATNTIDYTYLQDTVIFQALATDTLRTLNIFAYNDGLPEGTETIKIYVLSGCGLLPTDSITIEILDSLDFILNNKDTAICLGDSINISGFQPIGMTIAWTPITYLANPNQLLTTITPSAPGTVSYTIKGTFSTCAPVYKNLRVVTEPVPSIIKILDMDVCEGIPTLINSSVSPPYPYNITWTPSTSLSNATTITPIFTGFSTQDLIVHVETPLAKCSVNDTIHVEVWPFTKGTISNDTLLCNGESTQLLVTGGNGNYLWYPGTGLSCTSCPDPIASALGSNTYYAILLEPHGCQDTLDVRVEVHPYFLLTLFNNDTTIYLGDEVQLNAQGAPFYYWTPGTYLTSTSTGNPVASPLEDITYHVTGVSLYQGCPQTDSVRIHVIDQGVFVPSVFSPNGDGRNDDFKVWARKLLQVQEFNVYNRWGLQVFSTKDIRHGWNGTYKGKDQDPGVYYYYIKVAYPTGRVETLKGDVTLVR